jgi:hypothetical protein
MANQSSPTVGFAVASASLLGVMLCGPVAHGQPLTWQEEFRRSRVSHAASVCTTPELVSDPRDTPLLWVLKRHPCGPGETFAAVYSGSLAEARASSAAGHTVNFDLPDGEASSMEVMADAIATACNAIDALAARPYGKRLLANIVGVRIGFGASAAVHLKNGVIEITVDLPAADAASESPSKIWPSSLDIQQVVRRGVGRAPPR